MFRSIEGHRNDIVALRFNGLTIHVRLRNFVLFTGRQLSSDKNLYYL